MRKILLTNCVLLFAGALGLTCCTDIQEEYHSIKTSTVSCVFRAAEPEPIIIEVEAVPAAWEVKSLADWVKVAEQSSNTFTLTAQDNPLEEERKGEVLITAGKATMTVTVTQQPPFASGLQSGYKTVGEYVNGAVISPNGIYAGGWYSEWDNVDKAWIKYVVIENIRTGDVYRLDPFPGALYSVYEPSAITDSGDIIFHCEDNRAVMFGIDGEITVLPNVEGQYSPWLQHVGSDESKVWVGFCLGAGTLYSPVKWTDGVAEILPKPEETYRGNRPWVQGCMIRGCSMDGRIMYGTAWEGLDSGLIWWDENNEPHWVAREVREVDMFNTSTQKWEKYNLVNGVTGTSEPYCMSPSGKWVAGTYYEEDLNEAKTELVITGYPAFYDIENDKLYTFPEYNDAAGITVTDDGMGVIGIGGGSGFTSSTEMIDIVSGAKISDSTEWIRENLGIIIPSDSIVEFISPDMKSVFGYDLRGLGGEPMRKWYVFPKPEK